MPVSPQLIELAKSQPEQAYELINHYSFSDRAKLGTSQIPGLSMLGSSMQLMQRSAPGVLHADFTACNSYDNGVNAAHQVSCPTLFLLGAEDKMTPVSGAKTLITNVRSNHVTILPRTGHALMIEQPNAVLDCLVDFVSELN
jgi:pimeloyl-ACP methyl ester carboxylesterase